MRLIMNYHIPEWWYQAFLVIIFAFTVFGLVSFMIYKKKVKNEIDRLVENSVRLYKENENYDQIEKALLSENSKLAAENERLRSRDLHEHIVRTNHPIIPFVGIFREFDPDNEQVMKIAKSECIRQIMESDCLENYITWKVVKVGYNDYSLFAELKIVDPLNEEGNWILKEYY